MWDFDYINVVKEMKKMGHSEIKISIKNRLTGKARFGKILLAVK